jgi:nucleoid DNA-binding protein
MPKKPVSKVKRKSSGNGKIAAKTTLKKIPAIKDPLTKSGVIKAIAEATGVHKKEIGNVFAYLSQLIEKHIKKGGPGKFVMPDIAKIVVINKPPKKAREGINPFTGEKIMIKAKPASRAIKIKPLKKLKEMVA